MNPDYIKGLFDGAKMGQGRVEIAIEMAVGHMVGTANQLAEQMGVRQSALMGNLSVLHERGFVCICAWDTSDRVPRPIYTWAPGEPDCPKPQSKKMALIEKAVANEVGRVGQQQAVLADVASRATKHGTEEKNGAVRTHRMRG